MAPLLLPAHAGMALGTTGEGIEQDKMVALDAPPAADLPRIRKLSEHGVAKWWWHWEEECVTTA